MIGELEAIKALLWKEWDPIGVNDDSAAFGEYDSYADQVYLMLAKGAETEEIARHLSWVVDTLIGLETEDQHSAIIANKAVAIHLRYAAI